jgi:hypothetical protein
METGKGMFHARPQASPRRPKAYSGEGLGGLAREKTLQKHHAQTPKGRIHEAKRFS